MEYHSAQGPQSAYPQVLLLGNGLNRAFGGESWEGLIKKFWKNDDILYDKNPQVKEVPFPLQVVLGTKDAVDAAILENRAALCCLRELSALRTALEPIWDMGFDHILTTNYSYELECAADPALEARLCPKGKCFHKKCPFKAAMSHTSKHAEMKYLLHTYNVVAHKGREQKIWHIHGEARKPDSIILGHYLYGKLLQNYDKHFSARADEQRKRQQNGQPPLLESWLDAFIMGDVYILGFGSYFSEWDFWWLLNRKKRERARHGKTVFYAPKHAQDTVKHELLKVYGVDVRNLGFDEDTLTCAGKAYDRSAFFRAFCHAAIEDMQTDRNTTEK